MSIEFDSLKHRYILDGVILPSVTQIINGNKQYFNRAAADRGSKVHTLTYMHDRGDLGLEMIEGTEYYNYVSAWICFCKEMQIQIINREYIVYNDRCAGTVDVLCIINGELWLLDIKSGVVVKDKHELQVTGYKFLSGFDAGKIKKIGCVYLNKNGTPSLIEYEYKPFEFIKLLDGYYE